MSFKHLFSRSLQAERLHMAAHSHHLWPDASREGQLQAWDDAARLADRKWDRVMGEVWPEAQRNVAAELGSQSPQSIVFASNTHELLVRLLSAMDQRPVKILSTDGEFHSFRRQVARWRESGQVVLDVVPTEPFDDFPDRFAQAAIAGDYDLIFASQVFFQSGQVFERVFDLAPLTAPNGTWLVVDGYHGFMALPGALGKAADQAFYVAGGYKYAMAGEGVAFMHAPPGYGERPAVTGWYAEFGQLTGPPGGVGYTQDAGRFLGATFDPSALYRLNAVFRMLREEGLDTEKVSAHVHALQDDLLGRIGEGAAGRLRSASLLNPPDGGPRARFLAFRHPQAALWASMLGEAGVVVDVRGHVLRVGLGLYHDTADLERFCSLTRDVLGD